MSLMTRLLNWGRSALFWTIMGPVMVLLTLLRPFVFIRVQSLLTYRIGHFAMNTEMYLCERDAGIHDGYLDYFFHTPKVCNSALKAMIDRGPLRIKRWPVYIMKAIERSGRFRDHIIPTWDKDKHSVFENAKPHFSFLPQEEQLGRAFLDSLGVEGDRFVCLLCRDKAYLENHIPGHDWSYHNYRDVDVATYLPAMEALADKGYHVFRMGAVVAAPLQTTHPRVIDYATNGMRTELLDIYLASHCRFFVSNGTGLDALARMFKRPILYSNYISMGFLDQGTARECFVPKLLRKKGEDAPLSFREMFAEPTVQFSHTELYQEHGLEIIDNEPWEIVEDVLEVEARTSGTWQETPEDLDREARFWSLLQPTSGVTAYRHRVGAMFLRRRAALLE